MDPIMVDDFAFCLNCTLLLLLLLLSFKFFQFNIIFVTIVKFRYLALKCITIYHIYISPNVIPVSILHKSISGRHRPVRVLTGR